MLVKAAVVAAGVFGLWYVLAKPREPAKSWQMLKIIKPDGTPMFMGPYEVTEKRAVEWATDAREEHWGSTVTRLRCDAAGCKPVAA